MYLFLPRHTANPLSHRWCCSQNITLHHAETPTNLRMSYQLHPLPNLCVVAASALLLHPGGQTHTSSPSTAESHSHFHSPYSGSSILVHVLIAHLQKRKGIIPLVTTHLRCTVFRPRLPLPSNDPSPTLHRSFPAHKCCLHKVRVPAHAAAHCTYWEH